jgi:DNA-binding transcriptional LysR family regulator
MEIRQLKYFLSVIQTGGIGSAAEAHYVTQPAVSIQLKKLEEEVGEKLFVRQGRKIVPTQAGLVLAEHAEGIMTRMDTMANAVAGLKGLESGSLRMGNIDAASVYVLPEVYRKFQQKYPGVKIEIIVGDTALLLDALRRGVVELATTTFPIDGDEFETLTVFSDEMVLVVHPKHVLAGLKRVTLEDVARTGVITYPPRSLTRRHIERVFIERDLTLNATMEIGSPEAIKSLTQAGLGASILPRPIVSAEVRRGTLRTITLGKVRFFREIGMVFRHESSLSPPARVFLEMVRKKFQVKASK